MRSCTNQPRTSVRLPFRMHADKHKVHFLCGNPDHRMIDDAISPCLRQRTTWLNAIRRPHVYRHSNSQGERLLVTYFTDRNHTIAAATLPCPHACTDNSYDRPFDVFGWSIAFILLQLLILLLLFIKNGLIMWKTSFRASVSCSPITVRLPSA